MKHIKGPQNVSAREIQKKKKRIIIALLTIITLIVLFIIAYIANEFIILDKNKTTNLVINNKNVTENLKKEILIKEGEIYINDQITNVPEDLEKAIIGVWGETDIEKPVVPIEKTIEDVLSDEMTKQEGYTEIAEYLDITRTIMAEKYRTDLGEIKIDSTRSKEISELVNSEKEKAEKLKESNEIER